MFKIYLTILFCTLTPLLKAQSSYDPNLKMNVYTDVDTPPAFPGAEEALFRFMKYYKVTDDGEGNRTLKYVFVVDTAGNLLNKHYLYEKPGTPLSPMEQEGLNWLDKMPCWIPGRQGGKKVAVRYIFKFSICLQE